MLQATRTSAISYSFAALFIVTTFNMSQIVHAIFEAKSLTVNYMHKPSDNFIFYCPYYLFNTCTMRNYEIHVQHLK